tara:strand:+ start:1673 stop:2722 length:1050 start_codon:yes stop_codon:yes gene_type:complete
VTEGCIFVTGGAGFIGTHFVQRAVADGRTVVTLDALTYAGNLSNLDDVRGAANHTFIEGSIADRALVTRLLAEHRPAAIVNFAAESHVDRSIDSPSSFVASNIVGVYALLEAARETCLERDDFRFLHVSTDEIYGSVADGAATEMDRYDPSSPYAASKAAADHLVRAWNRTYGMPTIITNCTNNYGPRQFPEKLIPLIIAKALSEESLPLYGDGMQQRDWLHVSDHCHALDLVLSRGQVGETYNVASGKTRSNRDVVERICAILDRKRPREGGVLYQALIENVADRPGHDRRYALDAEKIKRELGWTADTDFSDGLSDTVEWYLQNGQWVESAAGKYDGARMGTTERAR